MKNLLPIPRQNAKLISLDKRDKRLPVFGVILPAHGEVCVYGREIRRRGGVMGDAIQSAYLHNMH